MLLLREIVCSSSQNLQYRFKKSLSVFFLLHSCACCKFLNFRHGNGKGEGLRLI